MPHRGRTQVRVLPDPCPLPVPSFYPLSGSPGMASRRRAAPASSTTAPDEVPETPDVEEVPGADQDTTDDGEEAAGGAEYRDPEGDEVSKPATKPTAKKAQPKVQQRKEPLVPGGSAAAAREAAPSDFIKAKIPDKYGSATIYGRGGKETVHAGGEVVEMTRAQAERIGATPVKAKGRTEPAPDEGAAEE